MDHIRTDAGGALSRQRGAGAGRRNLFSWRMAGFTRLCEVALRRRVCLRPGPQFLAPVKAYGNGHSLSARLPALTSDLWLPASDRSSRPRAAASEKNFSFPVIVASVFPSKGWKFEMKISTPVRIEILCLSLSLLCGLATGSQTESQAASAKPSRYGPFRSEPGAPLPKHAYSPLDAAAKREAEAKPKPKDHV